MKLILVILLTFCYIQINAQETKAAEKSTQPQVVELKSVTSSITTQQGILENSTATPVTTSKSSTPTEAVELRIVESKREDD